MKGCLAVIDRFGERCAAALLVDGRLGDLFIDPPEGQEYMPGAVWRGVAERPLKGQGGFFVRLGNGIRGFLRQAKGVSAGESLVVQVAGTAEPGKAVPLRLRPVLKDRHVVLTPGAPGRNLSRRIRDEAERERLELIVHAAMEGADESLGLIVRSAASGADAAAIESEIIALRAACECLLGESAVAGGPELLLDAPAADARAWQTWTAPAPDSVDDRQAGFEHHGVWEQIGDLLSPEAAFSRGGAMFIEPTRALVAVDVNTGGDFSPAAGHKANLAAARELPRQLRLRGLGGQIVVDFAPMPRKERRGLETALARAFRDEGTETAILGWTPMGHLELQRKRDRLPLGDMLRGTPFAPSRPET